jgi:carboxypeptidase Q
VKIRILLAAIAAVVGIGVGAAMAQQGPPPPAPIPAATLRTVEALQEQALATNHAYDIVEDLTTRIGPRLAGSPAEQRAIAWGEQMLRSRGFRNVRVEPFTIPYWARTFDRAEVAGDNPQPLVVTALAGSPSTPEGGLEGQLVRFESLTELTAATAEQVRGKIVFIDEPTIATMDGAGYGMAVRRRSQCAPLAQERGAIACVIRSVGTHSHRFAHQGGNPRQANGANLPAAAVSPPDADQLTRLMALGPVRIRLEIHVEMSEDAPSANVVGEIVGRERPEEIVLIGAHLDSWDQGTGALDDGAGVGIVTAAAQLIGQLPRRPRRTIRVVLFGAEETGIWGARAYAAAHAAQMPMHIIAAESDFGARPIWRFQTRLGEGALPFGRAIQGALQPLGVTPGNNLANGGPDLTPMREAGVPVVDLSQNGLDYFNFHHTPDDTLDKIDPEELRQNVAAYATFAYLAAEMDWDFRAPGAPRP